jgi:hypothetical protein
MSGATRNGAADRLVQSAPGRPLADLRSIDNGQTRPTAAGSSAKRTRQIRWNTWSIDDQIKTEFRALLPLGLRRALVQRNAEMIRENR